MLLLACVIGHIACTCSALPRVLRADRGTENTRVAFLQPFLRDKDEDNREEKIAFFMEDLRQIRYDDEFHLNLQ